jgi:hypothetical protein
MSFYKTKFVALSFGLAFAPIATGAALAATSSAVASAKLQNPITIDNLSDIDFGPVVGGSGSGQVELNIVDGNRYCYTTAICVPGSHSFAEFNVKGSGLVNISYPLSIPFTGPLGQICTSTFRRAIWGDQSLLQTVSCRLMRTAKSSASVAGCT